MSYYNKLPYWLYNSRVHTSDNNDSKPATGLENVTRSSFAKKAGAKPFQEKVSALHPAYALNTPFCPFLDQVRSQNETQSNKT